MKEKKSNDFKKYKITLLNSFLMKSTVWNLLFASLIFLSSILTIVFVAFSKGIDDAMKVSIISMGTTFIITTAKSMIDRLMDISKYFSLVLTEEQRALNDSMGVKMEKTEFENLENQT